MLKIWIDGSASFHYKCLSGKVSGGWGAAIEFEGTIDTYYGDCQVDGSTQAELLALVNALEIIECRDWDITVYSDSKTMIDFINSGELDHAYHANFNMQVSAGRRTRKVPYKDLWRFVAQEIRKNNFTFVWIDRNENQEADKMAGIGREVCERKDIESRKKKEKKDAQDRESLKMIKERFYIR